MEKITLTFNELRRIKDALPSGSSQKIADKLGISVDTVRNYFGGKHYEGSYIGIHFEQGPDGGIVSIDDPTILNLAKKIIAEASTGN
ncbi:MAG: DNA-binding protein [Prevotellaceae bacterium]|jgi:hypothetical protein|nr:DNA-binding protein [Prevotellaceae bacterium]